MNSLNFRLLLGVLLVVTFSLGVGGMAAYQRIEAMLYEDFDRRLVQRARSLSSMIEVEFERISIEWLESDEDPPGHEDNQDYYAIWLATGGEALIQNEGLGAWELPRFGASAVKPEFRDLEMPEGRDGRAVGYMLEIKSDEDEEEEALDDDDLKTFVGPKLKDENQTKIQLVFGKVDTVAQTMAGIRSSLIGLWIGCGGMGSLLGWLVVRRSLHPINKICEQIGSLKEGNTGQRIKVDPIPTELEPITIALNNLLGRVEGALVRERTLTSNVAHELRTPVAGILSILEVTLCRLRSKEEYLESTQECLEIAKRLHWLVTNLLSVTRIEAGNVQLQTRKVLLGSCLREWWEPFQSRAESNQLEVVWTIADGVQIETDPEFLRVVVSNLFDNAVSYTPPEKRIRIGLDSTGNIAVVNQALDLDASSAAKVFDPFWRQSETPLEKGVHVGLGLNLSQKIVALLGGTIQAEVKEVDKLFEVQLRMA